MSLSNKQIDVIVQVLSNKLKNEALSFASFLRHVNTVMLGAEKVDMDSAKEWMFEHSSKDPKGRVRLETYNQIKGELELYLEAISEAADKGKTDFTWQLAFRLQGTYWERVFCRRFGIETEKRGLIYRPQKWHPLSAAGLAPGADRVEPGRVTLPDVIFMYRDNLVFAEIKNETLTTEKHGSIGAGYYGLPEYDWLRIKNLLRLKSIIPYWFVIHEHKRLGRWNVTDELCDWLVRDFRELAKPATRLSLSESTTDWTGKVIRGICYWQSDNFFSLDKALQSLRQ